MFPLLPALLLLILQGPSSIEKMALDGRLPAALQAVSRQMEAGDHRTGGLNKADEAVLASLLALSNDPSASHALWTLLTLGDNADSQPKTLPATAETRTEPIKGLATGEPTSEGFSDCRRSRDGPF